MGKMTLEDTEKIVKELSVFDKEILLQKLMDEIDPVDSETEKAWINESRSRLEAMRNGSLDLIDEDDAFIQAFASLDETN